MYAITFDGGFSKKGEEMRQKRFSKQKDFQNCTEMKTKKKNQFGL